MSSSSKEFFGSVDRNPRVHDEWQKTLIQEETESAKRNLMSVGGHDDTPVDLVEKVFVEDWQCISVVTGYQKELVRFRVITEWLSANEQFPGVTESKKFGETRYDYKKYGETRYGS